MSLGKIPELDRKGLRRFGLMTGLIICVLFGLLLPWLLGFSFPKWPWYCMAILSSWAMLHPESLRQIYIPWINFGLLASKITTPILMTLVFFLIFFPISVVLRIFQSDPMKRKLDPNSQTYRKISEKPHPERLKRPF